MTGEQGGKKAVITSPWIQLRLEQMKNPADQAGLFDSY
jgi:hypothetical protein